MLAHLLVSAARDKAGQGVRMLTNHASLDAQACCGACKLALVTLFMCQENDFCKKSIQIYIRVSSANNLIAA